ncbi:NADH-quinone oxidoreductase subunit J family protein [Dermatobacter hominis]|uniref:NADH-quinone oxidoreductase subunit J family protein n=1 Tax=Dermatobacter hominis TaxID=2884263 RepID=UPI001D12D31A|nr:NADH-quinone oxidoreductase subunit J [Dermatobacter hominis]UDY33915.1 NADH-quinone oxidoreductase subunit J [Dermatobacter hominis]
MSGAVASLLAATAPTFDTPANVAFSVLAVVMVIAAVRVVTTKNIVHAALWLIIVLGGNGIIYLLLQAEFVAMTQFLVYLGAIVVLFLFGIMLTRAPLGRSEDLDNDQRWMGIAVSLILLVVIGYSLIKTYTTDELDFRAVQSPGTNAATQDLAAAIFTDYLVPFEVVSVLLLAALIGAIVLARRD